MQPNTFYNPFKCFLTHYALRHIRNASPKATLTTMFPNLSEHTHMPPTTHFHLSLRPSNQPSPPNMLARSHIRLLRRRPSIQARLLHLPHRTSQRTHPTSQQQHPPPALPDQSLCPSHYVRRNRLSSTKGCTVPPGRSRLHPRGPYRDRERRHVPYHLHRAF